MVEVKAAGRLGRADTRILNQVKQLGKAIDAAEFVILCRLYTNQIRLTAKCGCDSVAVRPAVEPFLPAGRQLLPANLQA